MKSGGTRSKEISLFTGKRCRSYVHKIRKKKVTKASRKDRLARAVLQAATAWRWSRLKSFSNELKGEIQNRIADIEGKNAGKESVVVQENDRSVDGLSQKARDPEVDHDEVLCARLLVDAMFSEDLLKERESVGMPLPCQVHDIMHMPLSWLESVSGRLEKELLEQMDTTNCLRLLRVMHQASSESTCRKILAFVDEHFLNACEDDPRGMESLDWEDWKSQAVCRKEEAGMAYQYFVNFVRWICFDRPNRDKYLLPAFLEGIICLDRMSMRELERVDNEPLIIDNKKCLRMVAAAYVMALCS